MQNNKQTNNQKKKPQGQGPSFSVCFWGVLGSCWFVLFFMNSVEWKKRHLESRGMTGPLRSCPALPETLHPHPSTHTRQLTANHNSRSEQFNDFFSFCGICPPVHAPIPPPHTETLKIKTTGIWKPIGKRGTDWRAIFNPPCSQHSIHCSGHTTSTSALKKH